MVSTSQPVASIPSLMLKSVPMRKPAALSECFLSETIMTMSALEPGAIAPFGDKDRRSWRRSYSLPRQTFADSVPFLKRLQIGAWPNH